MKGKKGRGKDCPCLSNSEFEEALSELIFAHYALLASRDHPCAHHLLHAAQSVSVGDIPGVHKYLDRFFECMRYWR